MEERFVEVADGVLVRRHARLDLNVGLVVGAERCLVVDTRETPAQAHDLRAEVRRVTSLPWVVANTHGHHDHCFGNATFLPGQIWGHERCASMLRDYGDLQRQLVRRAAAEAGEEALADGLGDVQIVPPDHTFAYRARIDLGGREVVLRHVGLGHTDNDVVVEVPGAAVFAGDLVEEGAPPAFEDAFPLDWPTTAGRVAEAATDLPVVPGHGGIVDARFVREQAALLEAVARVAREAFAVGRSPADVATELPDLPSEVVATAVARAHRQLRGEPPYPPPAVIRAELGLACDAGSTPTDQEG
ncbi:MBL fold metallo-hydrolase [Egicoccus sp. AB-alg2]|uniref:MBL fold metallo-hydrolase n=1 Tax=Egicoccus sp. AB-alg2 TaxID=3242693 RepID=UPI00359D33BB